MSKHVWAAGAVVLRDAPGGPEVVLVHRPKYDDWSLPKGKAEAGEQLPATAVRELREETGLTVRLGQPLDTVHYALAGGDRKHIAYWRARVVADAGHRPDAEVDEIRWLGGTEALRLLSYETDRRVLRQVLGLPASTPFLIVRHGKAQERKTWHGADVERPLAPRGHRQAGALAPLVAAYRPAVAVSSPAVRCRETLTPFARQAGLEVTTYDILTEEAGGADPAALETLIRQLAEQTVASATPLILCGHRPLLPVILRALGIAERPFGTGDLAVAHLAEDAVTTALETHPSPQ